MVMMNSYGDTHNYYYVKWTGAEWRKTFVASGGYSMQTKGPELSYSGGMTIDVEDTNCLYCSVLIFGSVVNNIFITQNSLKNKVYPEVFALEVYCDY
jgi:hypothetical protein